MKRSNLEHLILACGAIAGDDEIIVIGSQSILGQFPNAPARLLASMALHKLIDCKTLMQRLKKTDLSRSERSAIKSKIGAAFASD